MPIASEQSLRSAQAGFLADYTVLALDLAAQIGQLLSRFVGSDGLIPLSSLQEVQNTAQDMTLNLYVDPTQGAYASDGVTPVSDYSSVLNQHLISATVGVVAGHAAWLNNRPDDVASWLSLPPITVNPAPYPFRSNPLAQYDPFHTWVDPRGWDLSQRIWEVGLNTRRKIGEYLDYNIRQGTSALTMSRELEQFLVPGRANFTTTRPYGTTASFDALRLARTEIARAHTEASFASAYANPFVTGMDWKLSPRHPKMDVCDRLATIGMGGQRLREPYPLDEAPHVVENSHPQCICCNLPALGDITAITAQIRAIMDDYGAPPSLIPIDLQTFLIAMLGTELFMQVQVALAGQ